MDQMNLTTSGFEPFTNPIRKRKFLDVMNLVIPSGQNSQIDIQWSLFSGSF